jgi:hypothetical protein
MGPGSGPPPVREERAGAVGGRPARWTRTGLTPKHRAWAAAVTGAHVWATLIAKGGHGR